MIGKNNLYLSFVPTVCKFTWCVTSTPLRSLSGSRTSATPPPLTSDLWDSRGVVFSSQFQDGSVNPIVGEGSVLSGMMCLILVSSRSIFFHLSSFPSSLLSFGLNSWVQRRQFVCFSQACYDHNTEELTDLLCYHWTNPSKGRGLEKLYTDYYWTLTFLYTRLQRLSAGSQANLRYSGIVGKYTYVYEAYLLLFLFLPLSLFILCLTCRNKTRAAEIKTQKLLCGLHSSILTPFQSSKCAIWVYVAGKFTKSSRTSCIF